MGVDMWLKILWLREILVIKVWPMIEEYLYQLFIALDQLLNVATGGTADETLSSRCYRLNEYQIYRFLEIGVNALFYLFQGKDHCKNAYIKEVNGRHLSTKFFERAYAMNLEYDRLKFFNQSVVTTL
jgi:hypothetical protein